MRQGRYVQSRGGFAQTTSSTGIGKVHEKQLKYVHFRQIRKYSSLTGIDWALPYSKFVDEALLISRGTNLRVATPSGQMFSFTPAAVDPDICRFLWNVSMIIRRM